ncbi:PIN domain-containing protein [Streptomyces sp. 8L]|uniref:PIN domain-containing protein n=1 Tax=Streptomyces sp. 8L TaxID=2877242 RepID=UPI001CD4AB80|nr:PIN domain-containing protein [Streptomyces sp. 8L]MCA1221356.1 PIN domain-containing protein [Streptomyces sp. 8L]
MAFVAVYDADVLYPSVLRDVLIRVAQAGLVQAKWTGAILDETFRNVKAKNPALDPLKLDRTRELIMASVPDCLVKGYEPLVPALELPDPDDRHVLAAAVRAKAQAIVTYNLKDFPEKFLSPWDVEAVHPDAFLEAQIDLAPAIVYGEIRRIADSWKRPPGTVVDVIERLEKSGLVATVAALRALA